MREILFRGKSMNGGFWVEGSLRITTHQPTNDAPFKCYEIEDTTYGVFPDEFMSGICEVIDPETVGQFTGLTDKNGKKIFEGDILKVDRSTIDGEDMSGTFVADLDDYMGTFELEYANELEIIGNIHDNPELIGGGEDAE